MDRFIFLDLSIENEFYTFRNCVRLFFSKFSSCRKY